MTPPQEAFTSALMSLLRPVSIFLRNFLVKQHPYFSCCASCGEIKTPLEGRLCASLSPNFSVDAVILPPLAEHPRVLPDLQATLKAALSIRNQAPWLGKILLIRPDAAEITRALPEQAGIRPLAPEAVPAGALPGLPLEARVYALPDLAEYFLVIDGNACFTRKQHPLDFFTPNGIPLLTRERLSTPEAAVAAYPQTREIAARFAASPAASEAPAIAHAPAAAAAFYRARLARWSFEQGLAIVTPHAGPRATDPLASPLPLGYEETL